jgi:hypothetical protein
MILLYYIYFDSTKESKKARHLGTETESTSIGMTYIFC